MLLLLVGYYGLTICGISVLDNKTRTLSRQVFPVAVAAGEVDTCTQSLRQLAERVKYAYTAQLTGEVQESYRKMQEKLQPRMEQIVEYYLDDMEEVVVLEAVYEKIWISQEEVIQMCMDRGGADEEVKAYVEQTIEPLLDEADGLTLQVIRNTEGKMGILQEEIDDYKKNVLVQNTLLMLVVIVVLVGYLQIIEKKEKQERRMQEDLRGALLMAQDANAAKSQFLSNMSHDIRTPMNAIIGMTILAKNSMEDSARLQEYLEKISISSEHLLNLLDDILDMNEIESGKLALKEEGFSIVRLLDEVAAIVDSQAKARLLKLHVRIGHICKPNVRGDMVRLKQVLLNILENAVKFTPQGGSICLRAEEETNEHTDYVMYRIEIEDTGIGMSQETLDGLFDPFERGDNAGYAEGSGLGMPIVKNIVDMMNGQIYVDSAPGKGTHYTLILPFRLQTGKLRTECSMEQEKGKLGKYGGKRILLVEDNSLNMEIAEKVMSMAEVTVEEAWDGEEALQRIKEHPQGYYGLVFMDVKMPVMDGYEATAAIRSWEQEENAGHVPIVAMTANVFAEDRSKAIQAGMDDYISKPIHIQEIARVLGKYLGEEQ